MCDFCDLSGNCAGNIWQPDLHMSFCTKHTSLLCFLFKESYMCVSWGEPWGHGPPGSLKWCQKEEKGREKNEGKKGKRKKRKVKERKRKEGAKKRKKWLKDHSTGWKGHHSSVSRGSRGEKNLQGHQIDGGGGVGETFFNFAPGCQNYWPSAPPQYALE